MATATGTRVRLPAWCTQRRLRLFGPLVAGAGVMAYGILLRSSTFTYHGAPTRLGYWAVVIKHLGGYSDVGSLYFRDQMWQGHLPYVHYAFEYPIGTGMFAWLAALPGGGIAGYFAISAVLLGLCGLLTIWLLGRLPGANPWILALSPALALYVVLNWDLLSIAALATSLVLFHRRRDSWGGFALALATWTKFFPIVALPVVLLARLLEVRDLRGRVRAVAAILVPFAIATVVINGPFVYQRGAHGGYVVSSTRWFWFFRFNELRGLGSSSLWALVYPSGLSVREVNLIGGALVVAGLTIILAAMVWASRRRGARPAELIVPATLACIVWFLFANKVYSPQYALWVMALLAAAGAPVPLAVAVAAADLGFFVASFTIFEITGTGKGWFAVHVLTPSNVVLEALLFAVVVWGVWSILRRGGSRPEAADTSLDHSVERPYETVGARSGI